MTTLTANPKPVLSTSVRNLLVSHPLISFFVITFAATWLLFAPMVLGLDGLGLLPYHVPFWLYVVVFLLGTFSGPTVGALVVTSALEGKAGIRRFLRRYGQWRVGLQWYLLFLVGFPAVNFVAASLWMGGEPWRALSQQWNALLSVYLPALLIFPALINWGEEAGWRGFAQTRLQQQMNPLLATLLVGFLHGLWHLPVYLLVVGPAALGPFDLGHFLTNTVSIMVITIIWTWIFNGAKQSILIASLTHAALNAAQALFGVLLPTQPEQVGNNASIIFAVVALTIVVLTKGQLGYTPEQPVRDPASTNDVSDADR